MFNAVAVIAPSSPTGLTAADNDVIFEYGYVWLPYAVAALILFALGAVALVRSRRSSPRTAEVLFISGGVLAVLAVVILGLADGATDGNGLTTIDPPVWSFMIDHRTSALTSVAITVTTLDSTVSMTIIAAATVVILLVKRLCRGGQVRRSQHVHVALAGEVGGDLQDLHAAAGGEGDGGELRLGGADGGA